jgi:hypothetical protein
MSEQVLFGDSRLPDDLDARVRSELAPGERLLWVGQPRPGRFARSAIPIALFGIPFTAFALFWIAMASGMLVGGFRGGNNGPGGFGALFACFPLFGVPFLLVGLGMLTSPYWLRRLARRTCYALTDRRAILWQAGWLGGVEVRSYGPADLTKLRRTEYADGGGDLVFEEVVTWGRDGRGNATVNRQQRGFLAIDNVRQIEELLRKALLPGDGK